MNVCHFFVLACHSHVFACIRMSFVCESYVLVIRMSLACTCVSYVRHSYGLVLNSMSLVCTLMSFACHSFVLIGHPYLNCMYSYIVCMSLACTRISSLCNSYVLVCHPYVTRAWFYHEPFCTIFFRRFYLATPIRNHSGLGNKDQIIIIFFQSWVSWNI